MLLGSGETFAASTPRIGFRFGASVCFIGPTGGASCRENPDNRALLPGHTVPENVVPRRLAGIMKTGLPSGPIHRIQAAGPGLRPREGQLPTASMRSRQAAQESSGLARPPGGGRLASTGGAVGSAAERVALVAGAASIPRSGLFTSFEGGRSAIPEAPSNDPRQTDFTDPKAASTPRSPSPTDADVSSPTGWRPAG